jgi:hypothetical protein
MSMYDEELKSSNHRTKGHIKVWEHLRMGRSSCNVVDLCYRQLIERIPKNSRGCP